MLLRPEAQSNSTGSQSTLPVPPPIMAQPSSFNSNVNAGGQAAITPTAPLVNVLPVAETKFGPPSFSQEASSSVPGAVESQGVSVAESSSQSPSVQTSTTSHHPAYNLSLGATSAGAGTGSPTPLSGEDNGPKQLIVNYIAPQVTELELKALFEQFGPVECARIIYDKHSGGTKGYGFVYYQWSDHAAKAIKFLQGFELYGKYLRVGYAVPQRPLNAGGAGLSTTTSPNSSLPSSASNSLVSATNVSPSGQSTQSQQLAALLTVPIQPFGPRRN
jgi:hypothetical protein